MNSHSSQRSRALHCALAAGLGFAVLMSGPGAQAASCAVGQPPVIGDPGGDNPTFTPVDPAASFDVVQGYESINQASVKPVVEHFVRSPITEYQYLIEYRVSRTEWNVSKSSSYKEYYVMPFMYDWYNWRWHDYSTHSNRYTNNKTGATWYDECKIAWNDPNPDCNGHGRSGYTYRGHTTTEHYTTAYSRTAPNSRAVKISAVQKRYDTARWMREVPSGAMVLNNRTITTWSPYTWSTAYPTGVNGVNYRISGTRTVLVPANEAGAWRTVGSGDDAWSDALPTRGIRNTNWRVAREGLRVTGELGRWTTRPGLLPAERTRVGAPTPADDTDGTVDGWLYLASPNKSYAAPTVWRDLTAPTDATKIEQGRVLREDWENRFYTVLQASGADVTRTIQGDPGEYRYVKVEEVDGQPAPAGATLADGEELVVKARKGAVVAAGKTNGTDGAVKGRSQAQAYNADGSRKFTPSLKVAANTDPDTVKAQADRPAITPPISRVELAIGRKTLPWEGFSAGRQFRLSDPAEIAALLTAENLSPVLSGQGGAQPAGSVAGVGDAQPAGSPTSIAGLGVGDFIVNPNDDDVQFFIPNLGTELKDAMNYDPTCRPVNPS